MPTAPPPPPPMRHISDFQQAIPLRLTALKSQLIVCIPDFAVSNFRLFNMIFCNQSDPLLIFHGDQCFL